MTRHGLADRDPLELKSGREVLRDSASAASLALLTLERDGDIHKDARQMRMHLILEEVIELADALAENDKQEVADALGDLLYVVFGTALKFDIPIRRVFIAIHASNMTKDVGDKRRPVKGDNFREPEFEL